MNETILTTLSPDQFDETVKAALEATRDGRLLDLGASPLAASDLTTPALLAGRQDAAARGRALQAVLQWGIERLRPGGERDWLDRTWRTYNILEGYYLDGRRIADLAEALGYSDIHFVQSLRPQAIAELGQLLRQELADPQDEAGRRQFAVAGRYANLDSAARLVLRLLATFEEPLPVNWLHALAGETKVATALPTLARAGLLREEERAVALLPALRPYMRLQTAPQERRLWQTAAAERHRRREQWLSTAELLYAADEAELAAELLVARWQTIIDRGEEQQAAALQRLLARIERGDVSPSTWAALKVAHGRVAEFRGDFDAAQNLYEQALRGDAAAVRAAAYHRLAEIAKRRDNIALTLAYYERAIAHLTEEPKEAGFLVEMYLDRAMIFIQERQDLVLAEVDLRAAEAAAVTADPARVSDLHNVWASYYYQMKAPDKERDRRYQAWLTAVESGDVKRMIDTAHNLGQACLRFERYDEGLVHLRKSRELSVEAGNRQMEGLNLKTIGNAQFWLGHLDEATQSYHQAYDLFAELGNLNWLAYVCHELVEVYAEQGQWAKARRYLGEGSELGAALDNRWLLKSLAGLVERYPALESRLNARQVAALAHLRNGGVLTNKEYCRLADCSPATAARDLKDLLAQGVLVQEGRGRATQYRLV